MGQVGGWLCNPGQVVQQAGAVKKQLCTRAKLALTSCNGYAFFWELNKLEAERRARLSSRPLSEPAWREAVIDGGNLLFQADVNAKPPAFDT
jgi:hypothetical protein